MSESSGEPSVLSVVDFRDTDAMQDIYIQNAHATLDRLIHLAGKDQIARFLHDFTSLNFKGNVVQIGTGRKDGRVFCTRIHDAAAEPLKAAG